MYHCILIFTISSLFRINSVSPSSYRKAAAYLPINWIDFIGITRCLDYKYGLPEPPTLHISSK